MKKAKEYTRYCKRCDKFFKTSKKFGYVCDDCKKKAHKNKVMRTLKLF